MSDLRNQFTITKINKMKKIIISILITVLVVFIGFVIGNIIVDSIDFREYILSTLLGITLQAFSCVLFIIIYTIVNEFFD